MLRWHAFDTHGVVTTAAAAELGVPAVELRKLARRGALQHVGYGVYRMTEVPPTPLTEYAEAVAMLGPDAVVADDAALALHGLAQVNPRKIRVALGHRTRAQLPPTIEVVRRVLAPADVTDIDGVPVMTVAAALRACRGRLMAERLRQGAREALERRLIDAGTEAALQAELGDDAPAAATAGAAATARNA
jgi:predicted transcriptional regulator of viral defense system